MGSNMTKEVGYKVEEFHVMGGALGRKLAKSPWLQDWLRAGEPVVVGIPQKTREAANSLMEYRLDQIENQRNGARIVRVRSTDDMTWREAFQLYSELFMD